MWGFTDRIKRRLCRHVGLCMVLAAIGVTPLLADGVVTGCTQADLENAIAGGGDVSFNQDCQILITNPIRFTLTTRLDGAGHNVSFRSLLSSSLNSTTNIVATTNITSTNSISCLTNINCVTNFDLITCFTNVNCTTNTSSTTNVSYVTNVYSSLTFSNGVRLFEVASNAAVSFIGLRLESGRGTNGGAILVGSNAAAYVTNCVFTNNHALPSNGVAGRSGSDGGTIGDDGGAGSNGQVGRGGAICNFGSLTAVHSIFQKNRAFGGEGGVGGNGGNGSTRGGDGGNGGAGGAGLGGAIFSSGNLLVRDCSFEGNAATGGSGGVGGTNGSGAFVSRKGIGGTGGAGMGAGTYAAQIAQFVNCTWADNVVTGGGSAAGGMDTSGNGSDGARGGGGYGGGLCNAGTSVVLTNCTLSANQARGGRGADGGNGGTVAGDGGDGGDGRGGGLYNAGNISVVNCSFAGGSVTGGTNGSPGTGTYPGSDGKVGNAYGGNVANFGSTLWLKNSAIAAGLSGGAGYGSVTDAGNNICADKTLIFGANSRTNTDPKLGSLADNGGPTKTMLPLSGSPALDAGADAAAPNFDQRGNHRPAGLHSEIGAVDVGAVSIVAQPTNQTTAVGGAVTFAVQAEGESLAYQWWFNGGEIAGSTRSSHVIGSATTGHAGNYWAVITNLYGTVTSAPVALRVLVPPSLTNMVGDSTTFSFNYFGATGSTYVVEYKDDLADAAWTPVATNTGLGEMLRSDHITTGVTKRFYRVIVR